MPMGNNVMGGMGGMTSNQAMTDGTQGAGQDMAQQQQLNQQTEEASKASNIMKAWHDTKMQIIANFK